MIYSELYNEGTAILKKADIAEAALDARLLLEYICGTDRNTLLAHPDREVSFAEEKKYYNAINKRATHIPLQHITGVQEFMGLEFCVSPDVLIPRQDTEYLVEEVMRYAQDGMRVLDMCTGSGCILLSLMNYKNSIEGVGCDISDEALEIARKNADKLQIEASFLKGDLYQALDNSVITKFDIIVSNPPYIRREVIDTLMPEVKDHDPFIALCGGEDGLDFYRRIISGAKEHLISYGCLFLEIGHDQGDDVSRILEENGFDEICVLKDYSGNQRVVIAKYK